MKFQLILAVLLISFLRISTTEVSAQDNQRKIPIQVSAISDLDLGDPISFSPGMMLDVGLRIMNKPKINGSRIREREFYVKPFLGFYKREDYHTALMLGTDLTYRATYPSGIFWDANAGAGYMHLFYNTPVYKYENGTFTQKKFQGYANVVIKGAINLGFDLSKNNEKLPLGFFVGGGMFFRYPNNHSFVMHPYLQLGAMYTIRKDKK
ncbi:MAG TPA: hypothetical protein VLZ75_06370 [Chitinophagales bacterium]|nr:hypothetical protein [Chitinophagales bacterium]